jgi:excinuclease UvrABC nuclease subunit
MKLNKDHKGKCGIYCIKNIVNSKVYVGKAKDIYKRIRDHIYFLRKKNKNENRHLINA